MKVKPGVILPPAVAMAHMYIVVERVFSGYGYKATITSGMEGMHKKGSLHYEGLALDIRGRHIMPDERANLLEDLRDELGENYDIVSYPLENGGHIHIEYDTGD